METTGHTHRKNNDNTWDSICPKCNLIVARVDKEAQLARHERKHTCDPAVFRKPSYLSLQMFHAR